MQMQMPMPMPAATATVAMIVSAFALAKIIPFLTTYFSFVVAFMSLSLSTFYFPYLKVKAIQPSAGEGIIDTNENK